MVLFASLSLAQGRTRAPGKSPGVFAGPIATQHTYMGDATKLPVSITKKTWKKRGTRAPGDSGVSRQTALITRQDPANLNSTTPTLAQEQHPFWTADERYIYFDSDRTSAADSSESAAKVFNIYRTLADGENPEQITSGAQQKIEPNVLNSLVAYVAGGTLTPASSSDAPATSGFNLYVLDLNNASGQPVALTSGSTTFNFSDVRHPSWSPSGDFIVFSGQVGNGLPYHLYKVNYVTGLITQLTAGSSTETAPAWSTDGNNIAFTSNASGFPATAVPITASGLNVDAHTEIWNIANNPASPLPIQVTGFAAGGRNSSNKNPAWSSTKNDPIGIVPTSLLAFASSRGDTNHDGVANTVINPATFDIWYMSFTGLAVSGTDGAIKLQTSTPGTGIDSADPAHSFDPSFQTNEDYPAWPQYIGTYRMVFQSDRGSNLNLWASTVVDLNAPSLLSYDASTREIVHVALDASPDVSVREVAAGSRVRFRVRMVDYESGVGQVYIQIKNPNSAQQDGGTEHKIFVPEDTFIEGSGTGFTRLLNVPRELDCQAINTGNYSYRASAVIPGNGFIFGGNSTDTDNPWPGFNKYVPSNDDFFAFSGIFNTPDAIPGNAANSFWLKLAETTPGVWEAAWTTPTEQSDWYIDVIGYDNAVDPFDPSSKWNWKIYDNVWGFTTKPFQSLNHILYVNDYDVGQKFFNSRFNSGTFFGANVGNTGVPTESWMTELDDRLTPNKYQKFSGTPLKDTEDGTFQHTLQTMGLEGAIQDINSFGISAPPNQDAYDMWRILSRGPVPINVLQLYGTTQEVEPSPTTGGTTLKHTVANSYVLWHTPYSGDLFVGPGTITDTTTQLNLTTFYKNGGRIFVNGQDVAWALSAGGSLGSSFLHDILGATYVSDNANGLYPIDINTSITLKDTKGDNPISATAWYDDPVHIPLDHGFLGENLDATAADNTYPADKSPIFIGDGPTGPRLTEYSALNQNSSDVVAFNFTPVPPVAGPNPLPYNVDAFYGATTNPAIMWHTATDASAPIGKAVYSPFGWEAIQNQFWAPKNTKKIYQNKNTRSVLIHNVGDFLRTGTIFGAVRSATGTSGSTSPAPLGGALVVASRRGVVKGTALTLADGSFSIRGLDAVGEYNLFATKTNFSGDPNGGFHNGFTVSSFHGGGSSRFDLFLYAISPGSISGKITAFGTGTPVAGAVVQATDNTTPTNVFTATSGADGTYSIAGVPGGTTYTLIVTAASLTALQFSASIPVSYPSVAVTNQANVSGQDFQLKPLQGHLKGLVTKGDINGVDTGVPLVGATVTATAETGGTAIAPAVTDGTGHYNLPLDPGSYNIVVTAPGYKASNPTPVTIKTNTDTTQNFFLTALAPGTLAGRVESSNHAAIVGATVLVYDANGAPILDGSGVQIQGTTVAALSGNNYTINNVPSGAVVHVTAKKSGYKGLNGLLETDFATPAPTVSPSPPSAPVITQVPTLTLDPLHVFVSTLSLVSSPYDYNSSPVTLFGIPAGDVSNGSFIMATWNGTNYLTYPTPPADTFHRGVGYFLQEPNATLALTTIENPLTPTQLATPYNITLKPGWNLIGDPFPFSINFQSLKVQNAAGASTDVVTAQSGSNPVLGAAMWTYDSGAYQISYTLDQWKGYWVRAFAPLTLIVDPAAQQPRSAVNPANTRGVLFTNSTGQGWKVELNASAGTVRSAPGSLGVNRSAINGYDRYKLESPPPTGSKTVSLSFNHDDWALQSGKYSVDVRSAQSPTNSWDFTVTSNVANTPVTLNWPGIATVPSRQALVLTDLDTKTTVNMRTQMGYTIPASASGNITRHFRIDVKQATRLNLALTDVVAHINPSQDGRSVPSAGISYTLTSDATVQVKILSNGRSIRTIAASQSRAAGSADLLWDLKNDQGVTVSGNLYTVEIRATDTQGHLVRRIVPLVVAR